MTYLLVSGKLKKLSVSVANEDYCGGGKIKVQIKELDCHTDRSGDFLKGAQLQWNSDDLGSCTKGQLISKGLFKVFICTKKEQKYFYIYALAKKKRSNQKSSVRESK